ncbi:hypothetical protein TPA0907_11090 [Micromonospora humidisoli]|nr:hypothetical protein TPA0907_11090 [Micromonospora sp. AKA109]
MQPLDQPRRGGALAGAGGAEQHGVTITTPDPALKIINGGRLVAGRLELADDLEATVEPGNVERHDPHGTPRVRHFTAIAGQPVISFDIAIVAHIAAG